MSKHSPVEAKTIASTGTAAVSPAVTAFVIWLIGWLGYHGSPAADKMTDTLGLVPLTVSGIVGSVMIPAMVGFAGWLTHHTPRPSTNPAGNVINVAPGFATVAGKRVMTEAEQRAAATGQTEG